MSISELSTHNMSQATTPSTVSPISSDIDSLEGICKQTPSFSGLSRRVASYLTQTLVGNIGHEAATSNLVYLLRRDGTVAGPVLIGVANRDKSEPNTTTRHVVNSSDTKQDIDSMISNSPQLRPRERGTHRLSMDGGVSLSLCSSKHSKHIRWPLTDDLYLQPQGCESSKDTSTMDAIYSLTEQVDRRQDPSPALSSVQKQPSPSVVHLPNLCINAMPSCSLSAEFHMHVGNHIWKRRYDTPEDSSSGICCAVPFCYYKEPHMHSGFHVYSQDSSNEFDSR